NALFLRYAAQECEVSSARQQGWRQQTARDAVQHRAYEVGIRNRFALGLGNRYQRHLGKRFIQNLEVRQILAPVQRGKSARRSIMKERKVKKLVDVKVQDFKLRCHPAQLVEHDYAVGNRVTHGGVEPQRLLTTGDEAG